MIDYLASLGVRLTPEQALEIETQSTMLGSAFIRIDRDRDGNRTAVVLDTTRVTYEMQERGTKWEFYETNLDRQDRATSKIDMELLEQTHQQARAEFFSKSYRMQPYQREGLRRILTGDAEYVIQKGRTPGLSTMMETHRINGDGFQLRMVTSERLEMPERLMHTMRGWYDEGYPWYGAANAIMMQAERDLLRPRREARQRGSYERRHTGQRTMKRTRSPRGNPGFQS